MSHRHENSSLEKNLNQYSLIRTWLIIALETQAHNKFEYLKCYNHGLPLMLDSLIEFRLSSNRSRKFLSLKSAAWKIIFHCERIELHLAFLQKFQNDLHGNKGVKTIFLESLSTKWCNSHFCLLGQSQNSMWLQVFFEKNSLSS